MGERLAGSQKVRGSSPLSSTRSLCDVPGSHGIPCLAGVCEAWCGLRLPPRVAGAAQRFCRATVTACDLRVLIPIRFLAVHQPRADDVGRELILQRSRPQCIEQHRTEVHPACSSIRPNRVRRFTYVSPDRVMTWTGAGANASARWPTAFRWPLPFSRCTCSPDCGSGRTPRHSPAV